MSLSQGKILTVTSESIKTIYGIVVVLKPTFASLCPKMALSEGVLFPIVLVLCDRSVLLYLITQPFVIIQSVTRGATKALFWITEVQKLVCYRVLKKCLPLWRKVIFASLSLFSWLVNSVGNKERHDHRRISR